MAPWTQVLTEFRGKWQVSKAKKLTAYPERGIYAVPRCGRWGAGQEGGEPIVAKGKYQRWLEPDGLLLLEGWARDGLTDEQLAGKMGINPATLYDWKNKYPKISEALKKGKEVVDIQVENALLKRALGYDYQEQRIEKSDKDGTKIIQTIRHIPADTTAQIFWLKNRRPDKWRDKPIEKTSEDMEVKVVIDV